MPGTVQPIHVLIVDDDAGSRLLMRRALERAGFTISEAADGTSAVAAVEAGACNACSWTWRCRR
jgi:CheY-like chemotaxis protein